MTENSSATELVEHSAYPPIKYSVTEATVAELRERYGDVKEVTADNYDDVKAGKITPVAMTEPLVDLKFPDGFGRFHGTRDTVGKKNLVLITGRAWW